VKYQSWNFSLDDVTLGQILGWFFIQIKVKRVWLKLMLKR
jgi:hypothetical protein